MKKFFTSLFFFTLISVISLTVGCSTMADARNQKGKGLAYVYEGSFDKVWNEIPHAITAMGGGGPKIVGDNKQEGYILAQGGMSMVSYGENVAIFVEKVDENHTKVEIVSKRALATNVVAADWAPRIHKKLSELLRRTT
jgi:hypothetical protein